jgi:hypothetical protein
MFFTASPLEAAIIHRNLLVPFLGIHLAHASQQFIKAAFVTCRRARDVVDQLHSLHHRRRRALTEQPKEPDSLGWNRRAAQPQNLKNYNSQTILGYDSQETGDAAKPVIVYSCR